MGFIEPLREPPWYPRLRTSPPLALYEEFGKSKIGSYLVYVLVGLDEVHTEFA